MKHARESSVAGTPIPGTPAEGDARATDGLRPRLRSLCSACRQIFGMPDYERYLDHLAANHPDTPPMTRGVFFKQAMDRKCGKGGMRCC